MAYRVAQVQHFCVYTTLIISCKKSQERLWALISKKIDPKDPNADWQPLHLWTNDKALDFMRSRPEWRTKYFEEMEKLGKANVFCLPDTHIFAFQEMNNTTGKVQNDKAIFDSVTSLMKAQAYELDSLPQRSKTACVYQFNLLSVVDSDLLRILFDGGDVSVSYLDQDYYVARYIVKKAETFARVHFIRADAFSNALKGYDQLHLTQCSFLSETCDAFYRDVLQDYERTSLFEEDFGKEVRFKLYEIVNKEFGLQKNTAPPWVMWEHGDRPTVVVDLTKEQVEFLNASPDAKEIAKKALDKLYRYKGDVGFDNPLA